mgnify:CR=1 FL=1
MALDAIFTRRSVRQYQDKPVEKEKLLTILKAAMQAPSAANQQPWEFLVIENKDTLKKMTCLSLYASCLAKAAAAILVLKKEKGMPWPDSVDQDLGAATMALMLAAVDLGLGSVWLGAAPYADRIERMKRMFGLPDGISVYSVIALGYPSDKDANHFEDRFRKSSIHYEQY